jgi:FOG: TPR repeat, SEL1 subfamily
MEVFIFVSKKARKWNKAVLLFCLFILSPLSTWAQEDVATLMEKGNEFYKEGKYSAAVGYFKKAADMGHAEAQFCLGYAYYVGEGIIRNLDSAARWFQLSAAQGFPKAIYNLAFCYMEGKGVERDYDEALRLLRSAAESGLPQAQVTLAECYANGILVEKDTIESQRWMELSRKKAIGEEAQTSVENAPKPRVVYGPTKMKKETAKENEDVKAPAKKKKRKEVKPENQIEINLD